MAKRTRRAKKLPGKRIAIVLNGGRWYVRRIRVIEHDLIRDEKVYRCDKPIGKDFDCLSDAADAAGVLVYG